MKKIILLFIIIASIGCEDGTIQRQRDRELLSAKLRYLDMGKSVGRNGMLQYLSETNQLDSVTIDFKDLLEIEDNLTIKILEK